VPGGQAPDSRRPASSIVASSRRNRGNRRAIQGRAARPHGYVLGQGRGRAERATTDLCFGTRFVHSKSRV
jgi:hypothetical protein